MIRANLLPWRETQKIEQRWQLAWLVFALCVGLILEGLSFCLYGVYLQTSWETQYETQWQAEQVQYDRLNALLNAPSQQGEQSTILAVEQSVQRFRSFLGLLNRLEDVLPSPMRIKQMALLARHIRIRLEMLGENNLAPLLNDVIQPGYYQEPVVHLDRDRDKAGNRHDARIDIPLGI